MNRTYKISLSPEFYSDTVHVSQYDSDYNIIFNVFDKYSAASSIDGMTAHFTGTRSDGLGFTFDATASGSSVSFEINTSMTAVAGTNTAEIVFYDENDLYFGSANVQVVVEAAARPNGTIDADTERAEEIAEEIQQIVDTAAATVEASLGTLSNLTTTDKSSVVAAINEVDAHADTNAANISTNTTAIGTLSNLTTDAKTNLVSAINEVDAHADTNAQAISQLNTDLNTAIDYLSECERVPLIEGAYIKTSVSPVNLTPLHTDSDNTWYAIIDCQAGDRFTITGTGGSDPRLWAFIDSSNNVLSSAKGSMVGDKLVVIAPTNTAKLIVNFIGNDGICFKGEVLYPSAVKEQILGSQSYRNIFGGIVNKIVSNNVVQDNANCYATMFKANTNLYYSISAEGNMNRFILYGISGGMCTEIFRYTNDSVPSPATYSFQCNGAYESYYLLLRFSGSSAFDGTCEIIESQTQTYQSLNIGGVRVVTYDEFSKNVSADDYIYTVNLYDRSHASEGYGVNAINGTLVELSSYTASDYIPVVSGGKYTFSERHTAAWYDKNKNFISGVSSSVTDATLTAPNKACYMRFSHQKTHYTIMVNAGETALEYQPYSVSIQPQYAQDLTGFALDYETVKLKNSLGTEPHNLAMVAYKMVYGGYPDYQGFLFFDMTTNKFYYSNPNAEELEFLFDWNLTTSNNVSAMDYLVTITDDGDVIFLRKWARENPIIYPHTDYTSPVRVDFGDNPAPYGFLESISCVQFDDGSFVFGEYAKHSLTDEQNNDRRNIWKVTKPYTSASNWEIVHSFKHVYYESAVSDEPDNEIGHIHTVVYDFYADTLYCSTGDIDRHCRVWKSTDKGDTWTECINNGQRLRALGMTFTKDCAYWGTDSFFLNHALWKVSRDANGDLDFTTLQNICPLEPLGRDSGDTQATYGMILMREPYGLLLLERAEPRLDNKLDILFYSLEDNRVYTVATFNKNTDLASLVEPGRNGLCNQCFTEYQPDTCDFAIIGGGIYIRPNVTDSLHNSEDNYIGVLKMRVRRKVQ